MTDRLVGYRVEARSDGVAIVWTVLHIGDLLHHEEFIGPGKAADNLSWNVTPIVERVVEVPAECQRECCRDLEYDDEYDPRDDSSPGVW